MPAHKIVFLFDVDNTLLDNDRVTADLKRHLDREVGPERAQHYWARFEQLRTELGYADYLGALQRYRIEYPRDPRLLIVSNFLVNYSFANHLHVKRTSRRTSPARGANPTKSRGCLSEVPSRVC